MIDVLNDIEILEKLSLPLLKVLVMKKWALASLEKLLAEKKNIVETFEKEMAT